MQSSSLFLSVTARIELGFLSIDDPALSDDAAALVDRPDVFAARYGNMFVRGVARGGLFVGVLRVDTGSSEESQTIAGELEGAYGLFSAEASTKFEEIQKRYRNEVFVQMYHEGGPPDLQITDPADPLQLLQNANRFLQSFAATPDEVARPYAVTLAPITIARGPLPLNATDIQHAQDVLVFCAKRRSALVDQLNLLEFVVDNESRFDFTNGASIDAIRKAARDVQFDLDLIASCASAAINNPGEAKMPADFAEASGTPFTNVGLPSPMPASTMRPRVPVPDFARCATWGACLELASGSGLVAVRQSTDQEPAPFEVLSWTPRDDLIPEGSTVTVTTTPGKIDPDVVAVDLAPPPGLVVAGPG